MATPLTPTHLAFLAAHDTGVLAVHRKDGSIHQSAVRHLLDGDTLWMTTESKRLKARAVERDGWASYCVFGPEAPHPALTVEGPARIHRDGIGERTTRLFAQIFGRPVDPMSDEQLAAMDRVLIELTPSRVYAVTYLPEG